MKPIRLAWLAQGRPITVAKILVFAAACLPAAALAYKFYRFYHGDFNALTANPGDYITFNVDASPVLLIRDDAGTVVIMPTGITHVSTSRSQPGYSPTGYRAS